MKVYSCIEGLKPETRLLGDMGWNEAKDLCQQIADSDLYHKETEKFYALVWDELSIDEHGNICYVLVLQETEG